VSRKRSERLRFDGWLELLSRISELVSAETTGRSGDAEYLATPERIARAEPGNRPVPGTHTATVSDEDAGHRPGPDRPRSTDPPK
jgi:hypothetical protein